MSRTESVVTTALYRISIHSCTLALTNRLPISDPATLAAGFTIEGIRFAAKNEPTQLLKRSALLRKEYNTEVQEDDESSPPSFPLGRNTGPLVCYGQFKKSKKSSRKSLPSGPTR